MAYVEKFYYSWTDINSVAHEVKFLKDGASAGTTGFTYSDRNLPCVLRGHGSGKGEEIQLERYIWGSELVCNFVVDSTEIAAVDAMFESVFREWKVVKYKAAAIEWVGWLIPQNYARNYVKRGDVYNISISAIDALATLKDIEFTDFSTGDQFSDRVSLIETVQRALEHTGLELDFRVQLNTWCTNDSLMTSSQCAFDTVSCSNYRFTTTVDGREVNDSCYSILQKVLKDFNCILRQSDGFYWIENVQEKNSYYFPIPWSTLTVGTRTANDLRVTLPVSTTKSRSLGVYQKRPPIEKLQLTFRDRNIQENVFYDGGFDNSGGNEWNNTGYLSGFSTGSGYLRQPGVNWEQSGFDNEPTYLYSDDQDLTKNSDEDRVKVRFKYRISSVTPVGVGIWMNVRLWDGTSELVPVAITPTTGLIPLNEGTEWLVCEAFFQLSKSGTNAHSLRIYTKGSDSGTAYTGFNFDIDDVYMSVIFSEGSDVTFDRFYDVTNDDNLFTKVATSELFFGDSLQDNDIGSFQIGSTRTETWSRYGKSENTSIQLLHAQNVMENFSRYKDYIRELEIVDLSDVIKPHSLITLGSRDYQLLTYSIKYFVGSPKIVTAELLEVLNAAVTTSVSNGVLSTIDGASEGGTTVIQSGSGGVTDHGALTGLLDNDHTQYLLRSGASFMTGDLDLDNNEIIAVYRITATDRIRGGSMAIGTNKWELVLNGNNLDFKYNGTAVAQLTTAGRLELKDDINLKSSSV
jgi:hypothetical protein